MKKILVTGANGFLGEFIFKELSHVNVLFSLSRTSGDYKISLENKVPVFNQNFDLVIHSAGKAHSVPKNEKEKKQFYKVNVIGTENLLKGLKKTVIPKQFVFISSVSVYGQELGIAINEEHKLEARDAYGVSKIEAEKLIIDWCKKHNVICTILRLPLLVGKNPPGNLGVMLKAIDRGFYFNIGGGKARKSMVLAEDVASFLPIVAPMGGIYNLTDGHHPNFNELSSVIAENKNKKKPLNLYLFVAKIIGLVGDIVGNKAPLSSQKLKKITSNLTFDDTKARIMLGWKPKGVLEYLKNNSI